MSTEMKTLKASCLCGHANHDITLRKSDFPLEAHICNCNSCRHAIGTMYLSVVFLEKYYQPTAAVLDKLTPFTFSPSITYYFCPTCGCQMLARVLDKDGEPRWDPMTGTLDKIEHNVEWVSHEHVQDTVDGGFSDFLLSVNDKPLTRWPAHFEKGEQLPNYWTSPSRAEPKASPDDRLHGHCKCSGVEFWISRPTSRSAVVGKYWPNDPPQEVSNDELPPEDDIFFLRDHYQKYLAGLCACNSCRLAAGVEITAWAFVSTINISLDKDGKIPWSGKFGTLKQYRSSPGCYRYFCGKCGAIVFYDTEDRMYFKDIALGLLDAPEGVKAESWFAWRTSKLVYRDDAIPRAESFALAVEKGLRDWEEERSGNDLSGGSQSGGTL